MSDIIRERLTTFRQELKRIGLDGFIIPRADEHLSEYGADVGRETRLAHRLHWQRRGGGSAAGSGGGIH